jgi:hypothetical protein
MCMSLRDAPVCAPCWCAEPASVQQCPGLRTDSSGKQLCELCPVRLTKGGPHRPYGKGRAHLVCINRHNRAAAPPHKPFPRTRRPYETLRPTQKRERRAQLRAVVVEAEVTIGCPLEAITPPCTPSPADLIHLSTSVREQIRTVRGLHIPCEQTMIACKQQLATTHATETGTFAGGAYITDPLRFVSVLCAQSSFLAVGGDAGGGRCVLGITYSVRSDNKMMQHFAALLVYEGGDSWLELQDCRAEGLTSFTGDSAAFPHIWSILQHLISTRAAFLNGDWCFLNAVLGLMAPGATHPCPICIVSHKNFLHSSRYRTPADKHSLDRTHQPLLTIPPERIVPTPLHLFLGIGNRIILEAFSELFGQERLQSALSAVTTVHSAGCGGKSDLYDLNGPEISKFIKKECRTSILSCRSNDNHHRHRQSLSFPPVPLAATAASFASPLRRMDGCGYRCMAHRSRRHPAALAI